MKAITPQEASEHNGNRSKPDDVIEVFNQLVLKYFRSGSAIIPQEEIVRELVDKGYSRQQISKEGLLDVEYVYKAAGWEVYYDKPGFNESYPATFAFREKRTS